MDNLVAPCNGDLVTMMRTMLGLTGLPLRGSTHGPWWKKKAFKPLKANNNLYQNATIGTGYTESEFKNKSKRRWKPNVQKKNLFSEILQATFRVYVSMRAWRTIRKYGSLDNYLLSCPNKVVGEGFATELKNRVETCVRTGIDPYKKIQDKKRAAVDLSIKDYWERYDLSMEAQKRRELALPVEHTMGPWPKWKGESHEKLVRERAMDKKRGELFETINLKKKQLEAIEDEARDIILRLPEEELTTLGSEIKILDEMPNNNREDYYNIFSEAHAGDKNFTQENQLDFDRTEDRKQILPVGPGGVAAEGLVAPELSGFEVGKYVDPKLQVNKKATYQQKVHWRTTEKLRSTFKPRDQKYIKKSK